MSDKKLFLLDAYALIFRAYYALLRNPRVTSKGKNTNAQFGFTNTLFDLIRKENPTHIAVVFDTSAPTERHTEFADYKANRQETPEDLKAAVPDIQRIIEGFNIPVIASDGFEADDVIGGLALEAADLGYTVYMVTPDKDYGQLVRDNIFIYKPSYQGNGVEILGPKEVCDRWGIKRVDQVVDMLGLMGDAVDNIPGIAGVGEKTAAKLLAEYDTLENILANAGNIKGKLGEKIVAGRDAAILSKKLATIITNVPVNFHEENFRVDPPNKEALKEVFNELEFRTLAKRILGEEEPGGAAAGTSETIAANTPLDLFGNPIPQSNIAAYKTVFVDVQQEVVVTSATLKTAADTPHEYTLISNLADASNLAVQLMQQKEIAFDTETTGLDANEAEMLGMSFCWQQGSAYYVAIPGEKDAANEMLSIFRPVFENPGILWVGQNIKYDLTVLKWLGIDMAGPTYDTMLAHYVIEPEGKHGMDMMSAKYLNYEPISIESLIGKKGKGQGSMKDVPLEDIKEYAAEDADITLQLKKALDPLLDTCEVREVFATVENPLVPVLRDMEYEGVCIDVNFLNEYSKELDVHIKSAEESVYQQAGIAFNLASPKQLGEVLFDKMKLDEKAKKTKTGQYATGEDVLQKLSGKHPIVDNILVFRELTKLKSTYIDALPTMINPRTGRVHTNFNQSVAVTGRLSSINPNLQNIPIRTDRGREIRKAFVPRQQGWQLLSADYSQVELRIVAAISNDEAMITAFKENRDIHTATAARVYGVSEDEVTRDMRRAAKAVNFGIIYGQTAFGLAGSLGIGRTEAKEIIDNYFRQYPGIKQYMDDTINYAREHGFVKTLKGRKRYLADINSANQTVRGFAERNAINSPIQGTAAEMIKLAMIKLHKELKHSGLQARMILQVHDELVFDVPENEVEALKEIVVRGMESAMELPNGVPVQAEAGSGANWLAAH